MENSKSTRSNTGYKGIYFRKDKGKFESQFQFKKSNSNIMTSVYIGLYSTLDDAIKERENYIKSLF